MIRGLAIVAACAGSCALAQTPSVEKVERGRELYAQYCETCHGPEMVNPGTVSFDLRKFPPDARDRFVSSVMNGKSNGMPAWGRVIAPEGIESLWAYVASGRSK